MIGRRVLKCVCSPALARAGGSATAVFLALAVVMLASPSFVEAQPLHGAVVDKVCSSPRNTCDADSSGLCDDGNACNGKENCDTTLPNVTECFIRVAYADEFGDTVHIHEAWDEVFATAGMVRIPAAGNLDIRAVAGNTTCAVGAFPAGGCDLLPASAGNPAGMVTFKAGGYVIQPDDPDPLRNLGNVIWHDHCDAPNTESCSNLENEVEAPAETDLTLQCSPGTPLVCDDGAVCNGLEACDPATGCVPGTPLDCDDANACTEDLCTEATGGCVHRDISAECNDGAFCNGVESCDPAVGCVPGTPPNCDDGNACTEDLCDEATGGCVPRDISGECDDGAFCNGKESCDPATGCVPGTPPDCDDGVACTKDACDEESDSCSNPPDHAACDDGVFCNGRELCDALLDCQPGTPPSCDDNVECTVDACDPSTDSCLNRPDDGACDDGDVCTDDACDAAGGCTHTVDPGNDESCRADICRSAGFWSTHSGDEKKRSRDIAEALLSEVGSLLICGQTLDNTDPGNMHSILEALCVPVRGQQQLQVARQLTAAALNCILSGGDASCNGVGIADVFQSCNELCDPALHPNPGKAALSACIGQLDCFNNGGQGVEIGGVWYCQMGTCASPEHPELSTGDPCGPRLGCPRVVFDPTPGVPGDEQILTQRCSALPGNCHDADLCPADTDGDGVPDEDDFCFEPPGPAGSSRACNQAIVNGMTIFP